MIARVLSPGKNITIEVEASTVVALFDQLAAVVGVFGALRCGSCDGVDIKLQTRPGKTTDGKAFTNREAVCRGCYRILRFGIARDGGGMWAKNKSSDGGKNGWMTWDEITGGHSSDDGPSADDEQHHPDADDQGVPY